MPTNLLEFAFKKKDNCNIIKSDIHIISHMANHVIDLIQLEQFYIITYLKINFFLTLYYLIYLTF